MNKTSKTAPVVDNALPHTEQSGRFWENRKDRFHCGVDIYARLQSTVYAIEAGQIVSVHTFTSPRIISYWNTTLALVLEGINGYLFKYAELDSVTVEIGARVSAGDVIGRVGQVLNEQMIDDFSPGYIRRLKQNGYTSMLHFEVYKQRPFILDAYCGGNLFSENQPENLCDPAIFMNPEL